MAAQVDVLVVGAGPVGLYFSYAMSLYGHSVYCVDPKTGPTNQSRAIVLTSRTMEMFEAKGLCGEFLEEGFISSGIRVYQKGTLIGQMAAVGDTPYAYITVVVQNKTENILNKHLEDDTGNHVHWQNELVSYTQDEDKVTAIVLDKRTGLKKQIKSKYIIGADGNHSRVRKGNPAFTFEGVTIDTKFFLIDLTVKGEGIENRIDKTNVFMTPSGHVGMIPLKPYSGDDKATTFRIFGNLDSYSRSETNNARSSHGLETSEGAPSLEHIQSHVDKMAAPFKFKLSDPMWSSYYKINERIANTFRNKRAILVGDAAHCHSPTGGQGMNLSIQDADNLAWKLSYVLKGQASNPDKLLDSYESERKHQAEATLKNTGNATKGVASTGYFASILRDTFFYTAFRVPQIREYLFKASAQQFVMIDKADSNILGNSDKGLIQAGNFLPDTEPARRRTLEKRTSVLERLSLREMMIKSNRMTVFFIATCSSAFDPNIALIEAFWNQARLYPVKPIVIESSWHTHFNRYPHYVLEKEKQEASTSFYAEERLDSPFSITTRVGLAGLLPKYTNGPVPSVLLFVRPDLYVAQANVIFNQSDLESAVKYLDTLFIS